MRESRVDFYFPTFGYADELFWGHDRMEELARRVAGDPFEHGGQVEAILDRPVGIDRRRDRAP